MSDRRLSSEDIARSLGRGREVKGADGTWNTCCPAHNDSGPSLSVSEKSGRIMVYCHAGCTQDAVISELKSLGLWQAKGTSWTAKPFAPANAVIPTGIVHSKFGVPSNRWVYRNRQGNIAGIIYRFDTVTDKGKKGKEMLAMCWCMSEDGDQQFWWKQMPEPRCLYGEHRLGENKPILLVEGEKSCDAAQKLVGDDYLVLTWPGGGKAVKRANWKVLKGRDVVIWPDADDPGDSCARQLAEILIVEGARTVRRVLLPDGLEEVILAGQTEAGGWDLADEVPEALPFDPKTLIKTAPEYRPMGDAVIERFNRRFCMVMIGGQAVILHEDGSDMDGRTNIKYMSVNGFQAYYGNRQVMVGKQQVPESTYWLKHEERRSYKDIVFEPTRTTNDAYNLWKGFSVEPDPSGDWTLLEEHIRQNIASGDESLFRWLIGWFAHIVQEPNKKIGTSLAIRGKQGTGKTVIGKIMGQLYRPHYVLVEDSRYVLSNFNSHMASTLLLHADEAFFAGDPRNVGKLRGMVTSDTHRIELKGKESVEVSNHIRLLVTSNSDFIINAAFEERRFAVVDAGEGRLQDKPFFKAMWKQMKNGGFGGLLYHLQNFDLGTTDVTSIPNTQALQEQKVHSLEGVARFWFERLFQGQITPNHRGVWPEYVSVDDLYSAYIRRSEDYGERRRADMPTFSRELKRLFPRRTLHKRKGLVTRDGRDGFKTESDDWVYELFSLAEQREAFKAVAGNIDWPEEQQPIAEQSEFNDVPF